MNHRSGKIASAVIVTGLLAVAAYWYWSPFLALRTMKSAAIAHDAEAFNAHVDYPRLRESLKVQLGARVNATMDSGSHADKLLGAFGKMLGVTVVDTLVDAMVRPETVMRGMASGQFGPPPRQTEPAPADAPVASAKADDKPKWSYVRQGANLLVAYPEDSTAPPGQRLNVVFERTGFANWKLTDVRMPSPQP